MNVSGVRISRKLTDLVGEHETIRPLRDHIVLLPLEWEPSKVIKVAYWGKTLRGKVLAIGPGVYPKQYSPDRKKTWDSKAFRACDVKVGDVVELGGLELHGYDFPIVQWGHQTVIICREADVIGVVEPQRVPTTPEEFMSLAELPKGVALLDIASAELKSGVWSLTDNYAKKHWVLRRTISGYFRECIPSPRQMFVSALRGRLPDTHA